MKKINFILYLAVVVLLSSEFYAKEGSLKYTPLKPKAGDEITVSYNPANTNISDVKNIEIVFSLYSQKSSLLMHIEETHNYPMTKYGDTWTYKIKTTDKTDYIAVKFCDGSDYSVFDNNNGSGYFIRIYDNNGNETITSALAYATAFNSWATSMQFVNRDQGKSLEMMNNIFKEHPELKIKCLSDYLSALNKVTPDKEKPELFKKELAEFDKSSELTDDDYSTLIFYYKNLKMPDKESELINKAVSKFPSGQVAKQEWWKKFEAERDSNKQKEMAIKYHNDVTTFGHYETRPLASIFLNIAEKKDSIMLKEWWEFIKDKNWTGLESYGYFPYKLLEINFGIDVAVKICERGEELWKKEKLNATIEKTNFTPEYQNKLINARDEAYIYLPHAQALNLLNRKAEALEKYKVAFSLYPVKMFQEKEVIGYIKFLVDLKEYKTAKPIIEEAVKIGLQFDGMKDAVKKAYISENGNENGFDDYYTKLEESGKAVRLAKQKKQMINQPAPQFTLTDLDGKNVSLSDYKGKVVILDFWATWCGPCKASFPAMLKTIEKYKNDKDVVFLFINTWQTEIDKKKNAEDFIKENKYTFHVLLDNENKVVADFKVSSIPTKFVIDKNGNSRFNVVGSETGDVAVQNLSTMIELAKQ